ncbi:alpha/beta hydrolase family protein [Undibacterium fentianense]|uniref:S9 family peptidase n=1 Tax=Undibacterium fentianense TaxID=2828728 RepID=A0A941E124_9BURK|nr:alpha/beta fold hydrolase [Undibacterium fentianense]MBR7800455.1 S9 family peptidase [Undibacterium fentianense]
MKLSSLFILVCGNLALHVGAQQMPSAQFGAREFVQQVDLSPDGNRIVYLSAGAGKTSIAYVAELGAASAPKAAIVSNGTAGNLRWCKFVSNQRLICKVQGLVEDGEIIFPFTRLLALDIDGQNVTTLGQTSSRYDVKLRQFDGEVLDWLSGASDSILMTREYVPEIKRLDSKIYRPTDGVGVDHIDTRSLKAVRVESPVKNVDYFMTDGSGSVRMKAFQQRDPSSHLLTDRVNFHYRLRGEREWIPFSLWDKQAGMLPLHIDGESDSAYALKKLDGRMALYRVSLDGSLKTDLVHQNEHVDVDGLIRVNRNSRAIGLTYAEDKRHAIYFDAKYATLLQSLHRALPKLPMIDVLETSRNETRLLVRASSDSDPGRYYLYDVEKGALNELLLARPELENVPLASVQAIRYEARDGTSIPAYLTLPVGKEQASGLPSIVMPHGGPSARDEWGFDWLAQFFAHQGYAVIQPNFRGSAGFGDNWSKQNGFKGWSTSVGDVTDAAKWMIAKGLADPAKMAIVGWSYGGYAALQSAVVEPTLFKAIIAIAPVTDLELLKSDARYFSNADLVENMIGDGAHVAQGSPLRNVEKFQIPVLMFHGDKDMNVNVQHTKRMHKRLLDLDKFSEVQIYAGLEHGLDDSNARTQMLEKAGHFLKKNLNIK